VFAWLGLRVDLRGPSLRRTGARLPRLLVAPENTSRLQGLSLCNKKFLYNKDYLLK